MASATAGASSCARELRLVSWKVVGRRAGQAKRVGEPGWAEFILCVQFRHQIASR